MNICTCVGLLQRVFRVFLRFSSLVGGKRVSVGTSCFGDSKLTSKPESEELESSSRPPSLQKEYSDDIAPTLACCNAKRSSTFTLILLYESKILLLYDYIHILKRPIEPSSILRLLNKFTLLFYNIDKHFYIFYQILPKKLCRIDFNIP